MSTEAGFWKRCSSCKREIPFLSTYWVCNVSTCNRPRTGLAFCKVECWDAHVPMLRHRDSWAEEQKSPSLAEWAREQRQAEAKERAKLDRARHKASR